MPNYIPESIKLEAMKLYVSGEKTAKEIANPNSVTITAKSSISLF